MQHQYKLPGAPEQELRGESEERGPPPLLFRSPSQAGWLRDPLGCREAPAGAGTLRPWGCFCFPSLQVSSARDPVSSRPDWPGIPRLVRRPSFGDLVRSFAGKASATRGIHELLATSINRADLDLRMTLFSQASYPPPRFSGLRLAEAVVGGLCIQQRAGWQRVRTSKAYPTSPWQQDATAGFDGPATLWGSFVAIRSLSARSARTGGGGARCGAHCFDYIVAFSKQSLSPL